MDPASHFVRRANVDDLPGLKLLWEREGLQVLDLERRLTEFQLVGSANGELLGAAALHVEGKHGLLHSEAFIQPEQEDNFRPMLWDRLRTLARNHGLVRLWTLEQSPFWHQSGFTDADSDLLKQLPRSFGDPHHRWLSLGLREGATDTISLEKEFELFQQASRANMDQVMTQARKLRTVAYAVGVGLFVVAIGLGAYILMRWLRTAGGPTRRPVR